MSFAHAISTRNHCALQWLARARMASTLQTGDGQICTTAADS